MQHTKLGGSLCWRQHCTPLLFHAELGHGTPAELSLQGPCRCVFSDLSVGRSCRGSVGSLRPRESHHIILQMLLKRAKSLWVQPTHKDSTPHTFKSSFRFSSVVATQQGTARCKWILIKIYYKFINFSPWKHGLKHLCKWNRNLPLKFTTELVSNLSVTIISSETKENQPIKQNKIKSVCKIVDWFTLTYWMFWWKDYFFTLNSQIK